MNIFSFQCALPYYNSSKEKVGGVLNLGACALLEKQLKSLHARKCNFQHIGDRVMLFGLRLYFMKCVKDGT